MKMIAFFRRRSDLTAEQFRQHYETRHAPMAMRLFPCIRDYRRNYIRHDMAHRRASGGENTVDFDFDVITEISFADRAGYECMVKDMTDPRIRAQVIEDEMRFMDRDATVVILVDEEVSEKREKF